MIFLYTMASFMYRSSPSVNGEWGWVFFFFLLKHTIFVSCIDTNYPNQITPVSERSNRRHFAHYATTSNGCFRITLSSSSSLSIEFENTAVRHSNSKATFSPSVWTPLSWLDSHCCTVHLSSVISLRDAGVKYGSPYPLSSFTDSRGSFLSVEIFPSRLCSKMFEFSF